MKIFKIKASMKNSVYEIEKEIEARDEADAMDRFHDKMILSGSTTSWQIISVNEK